MPFVSSTLAFDACRFSVEVVDVAVLLTADAATGLEKKKIVYFLYTSLGFSLPFWQDMKKT